VAQCDAAKRSSYPAWLSGIRASVFIPVWIICGLITAVLISVADHSNQVIYSLLVGHGVVVHATVRWPRVRDGRVPWLDRLHASRNS
jgi:hypothetical protein